MMLIRMKGETSFPITYTASIYCWISSNTVSRHSGAVQNVCRTRVLAEAETMESTQYYAP